MRARVCLFAMLVVWAISSSTPSYAHHTNHTHTTPFGPAIYATRLPPEVVVNVPGMEWRVGAFTTGAEGLVPGAVLAWNNALQTSPNNLTKYPFHYLSSYNYSSTATVRVHAIHSHTQLMDWCGVPAGGCVRDDNDVGKPSTDLVERPFHVYVDLNQSHPASICAAPQILPFIVRQSLASSVSEPGWGGFPG
jgi:hypothetical protein